ncbi:MAG TPA: hypothetical protein VLZ75_11205 [Chitinophagales bacterium]|nr:hypothetical protein [Chitinophagales bacterium]
MKYFFAIIFSIVMISVSANEDTCRILNLKDIYMGMSFEELSDQLDLYKMEYYIDQKNHSITAEMFVRNSDINRLDFKFQVDQWENDSVALIPQDAILTYLMVTYNLEVNIESDLLLQLGAPHKETIREIKQIFFFDKQWDCINEKAMPVQITLTHKRVEYQLLEE